jgi:hypothetical protein
MRRTIFALGLLALMAAPLVAADDTSCTVCHSDADLFDKAGVAIVADSAKGVHAAIGLSCHDCHGGNPSLALADDIEAMDESYEPHPYRGAPERGDIPSLCGGCHSDPSYMRRYDPAARIDQEREYWTSHHGKALAAGDVNVATCVDCHGVHGMRSSNVPESKVHPTQVAETCASCHADAERMAGYTLPDGRSLPVDQEARWRQSVHATALFDKEDLFAPTCNDCHGNHGAAPPGLDSINYVCGQCHGREAEIFRVSPKHDGFTEHNEFLADAGEEACALCHEPPQSQVTTVRQFTECATCHGNHGVVRPTVAMFGVLPNEPCAFCHEGPTDAELPVLEPEQSRQNFEQVRNDLLAAAAEEGLEGPALFDWLVDQTLGVSAHSLAGEVEGGAQQLRPEFETLFRKFRIGKTYYTYEDPVTGREVRADVVRCSPCHQTKALDEDAPTGARSGVELVDAMRDLTARTARAERILLAAKRGGVETRQALLSIDQSVDAQIGLEVLVHSFSSAADSEFMKLHDEGLVHADTALTQAQGALEELADRRQWLGLVLVAVVLLLVALAWKIRILSAAEAAASIAPPT